METIIILCYKHDFNNQKNSHSVIQDSPKTKMSAKKTCVLTIAIRQKQVKHIECIFTPIYTHVIYITINFYKQNFLIR